MDIESIRNLYTEDAIRITMHAAKRLEKRGISVDDVISCVKNGKIIEKYPDDYPYPSCLILGYTVNNQDLHVVLGISDEMLIIITAYYPVEDKWETDFEKRKER